MGGAGTVKQWRDARSGVLYDGFPYAQWTHSGTATITTKHGL